MYPTSCAWSFLKIVNSRTALKTDGMLEPADGQELVITYKGNYVRIKYQQGQPVRITPEDKPKGKSQAQVQALSRASV